MPDVSTTPAYQALQGHFEATKDVLMKDQFASDPERFNKFSLQFEEILLNQSQYDCLLQQKQGVFVQVAFR